jgi:hypothetical protein
LQRVEKRRCADLTFAIGLRVLHQHADPSRAVALLRSRGNLADSYTAAEEGNELAPFHCAEYTQDQSPIGFQLQPSKQEIATSEMGVTGHCAARDCRAPACLLWVHNR